MLACCSAPLLLLVAILDRDPFDYNQRFVLQMDIHLKSSSV